MIIEDDIKIIGDLKNLEKPPDNWDILYFGGEVLKKKIIIKIIGDVYLI